MAHRNPPSPQRNPRVLPLADRTRIDDEFARMKEISHLRGIAATSRFVPPIKDISLYGFWDGFVGHPVDVRIIITIAAWPNMRYPVIDTSDKLVEAAEIHSISQVPDDPTKDADQDLSMPVDLRERILYDRPETWHGGDKRRKRRSVHVGERSVYGTEDCHGSSFGHPTEYRFNASLDPNRGSSEQVPYIYELAGDTLVASEAQRYMESNENACMEDAGNGLFVPRKRASPGKRVRGPLSLMQAFHETIDWEDNLTHKSSSHPFTNPENAGQYKSLPEPALSEQADDSSDSSVLVSTFRCDHSEDMTPRQTATRQPPLVPHDTFSEYELKRLVNIRGGCDAPTPEVTPTGRMAAPEQSVLSSAKDSLSPSKADSRTKRSKGASLTESQSVRVRRSTPILRPTERKDKRIRSRSLTHLRNDQRSLFDALMKLPSSPHNTFKIPRAAAPTTRPKIKNGGASGMSSDTGSQSNKAHPAPAKIEEDRAAASTMRPEIKNGAVSKMSSDTMSKSNEAHTAPAKIEEDRVQEVHDPPATLILPTRTRNGTPYSTDCQVAWTGEHAEGHLEQSLNDDPSDDDTDQNPLPKSGSGVSTGQTLPQQTRIATSRNTSDPPWFQRNLDSSRYLPENPRSPISVEAIKPYWNGLGGRLNICCPEDMDPGLYMVEVGAKIYLTEPDSDGWRGFRIPGLPFLEDSQPLGHVSLSVNGCSSFQFDQTFHEKTFASGTKLLVGSSNFGSSPILHVRNENCSHANHEQMRVYQSEAVSAARCRRLLEGLSFDDGTPNNDILVWLLEEIRKAEVEGSSAKLGNLWFAPLDFIRVKAAAGAILYGKEKPASTESERAVSSARFSQLRQAKESTNDSDQASFTKRSKQNGRLSSETENFTLSPAYFAGRASTHNQLEVENPSQLAWNLGLNMTRSINGMLQCRLTLEIRAGLSPLFTINARDWRLEFALIGGRLATQNEWRTTEHGDLALHRVKVRNVEDTVKIELHFHELVIRGGIKAPADGSRFSRRLPNVTDKTILGGSLTCNFDNAIIMLSEPNRGDVTWRPDDLSGRNSVTLPKLDQGYRMYLLTNEKRDETEDDWETLTDIDTVLDRAKPCPPSRKTTSAQELTASKPAPKISISPASTTEQSMPEIAPRPTETSNNDGDSECDCICHIDCDSDSDSDSECECECKIVTTENDGEMRPWRGLSARRVSQFSADLCYRTFVFIGYLWLIQWFLRVTVDYRLEVEQGPLLRHLLDGLGFENIKIPGFDPEHGQKAMSIIKNATEVDHPLNVTSTVVHEVIEEEREIEETSQAKGPSWRDVIDHALGWRELED